MTTLDWSPKNQLFREEPRFAPKPPVSGWHMSQISLTGTSADRSGTPKCRFPGGESFDCCVLAVPCNIVIPADEWRDCAPTIVIGKVIEETTARGMLLPEAVNAAT